MICARIGSIYCGKKAGGRTVGDHRPALRFFLEDTHASGTVRLKELPYPRAPHNLLIALDAPKTYLFPEKYKAWRGDKPITPKVLWRISRKATQLSTSRTSLARLTAGPPSGFAYGMVLLGDSDLKSTSSNYLDLSTLSHRAKSTTRDQTLQRAEIVRAASRSFIEKNLSA